MANSSHSHLKGLNLYQRLRERAIPERWADLHGNHVTTGHATAFDCPQVNIGPVLTGGLAGLGDCTFVLVLKGRFSKFFREKDGPAHLNGDSVYQWAPYPSRTHAEAGLEESLGLGYSLMASWAEFNLSKVDRSELERFVGQDISDGDGHKFFAVVGALESEQSVEQEDNESFEHVRADAE
jgi:hypothetical protein